MRKIKSRAEGGGDETVNDLEMELEKLVNEYGLRMVLETLAAVCEWVGCDKPKPTGGKE